VSVRHFPDIDQAVVLPTAQLAMAGQAVADLVTRQAMGAVHGPAGLGKTFAVEQALARRRGQVAACRVSVPRRPAMRLVAAALLAELTGGPPARRRDRFALSAEQLAGHRGRDGRERLVVVDEAQQLNRECIEFLRWLHDHRLTRFALLLAGRGRHLAGAVPRADAALADLPPGGLRTAIWRAGVRAAAPLPPDLRHRQRGPAAVRR
jgi:type II secretory pathway predicted ATPase ExeA